MSEKYKVIDSTVPTFITITVVDWVDLFVRPIYCNILDESLNYCIKEKGLSVHAYVYMTSHIHLMVTAFDGELQSVIRDFKKFTSKKIIAAIKENIQESRKDWMLAIFKERGTSNSRNTNYQFWRQDNQPKELYAPEFTVQKLNYIHNNPVEAGLVEKPEAYLYSSARNYKYGNSSGLLPVVFL